jgi:ribosomal protein S18 acetylase RimI-like enzyme
MSDTIIRSYNRHDRKKVLKIYNEGLKPLLDNSIRFSLNSIVYSFLLNSNSTLVAQVSDEVVGFVDLRNMTWPFCVETYLHLEWLIEGSPGDWKDFKGLDSNSNIFFDAQYAMNISVSEEHRRKGIANSMMDELLIKARRYETTNQIVPIYTHCWNGNNQASLKLVKKLGFNELGTLPGYYPDGQSATIVRFGEHL